MNPYTPYELITRGLFLLKLYPSAQVAKTVSYLRDGISPTIVRDSDVVLQAEGRVIESIISYCESLSEKQFDNVMGKPSVQEHIETALDHIGTGLVQLDPFLIDSDLILSELKEWTDGDEEWQTLVFKLIEVIVKSYKLHETTIS